jgi:hypothetical protein
MRYPYYPHPELFEPSFATLKFWLNTRKSKTKKGAGLFETDKFSLDRNWFIIVFIIELFAFIVTIWGGYAKMISTHKSKVFVTAIIASSLFVVLDYFGVLLHHRGTDDRTIAKSRLNFEHDLVIIGQLKREAFSKTLYQFFGFLAILFSAILKIWALRGLNSLFKGPLLAVAVLFYLMVMYVHLKHTGYWYFAWKTNKRMKKEFKDFQKDRASGTPSQYSSKNPPHRVQFLSYYKLVDTISCLNERVRVKLLGSDNDTGTVKYHYEIICKGVLWDEDIVSVTQGFDHNFQQDLYEACVNIQHAQLGTPVTQISTPNTITDSADE